MELEQILSLGAEQNASDLHFISNSAPWIRIDGKLQRMQLPEIGHDDLYDSILNCMNEECAHRFIQHSEIDFAYTTKDNSRFRVNAFKQQHGIGAAFRLVPSTITSIEELGLPAILKEIAMLPRGLVLVTGPTGSGKSTTLASLIDYLNENKCDHIITIEDPIEFIHDCKYCLISQREVFRHTKSFNAALYSALREDPDVILVGEMRDLETIRLALTAAETGHLVFATLHTMSAAKTIARIIDVFPAEEQPLIRTILSEALQAVISQALLPRNGVAGRTAAAEIMICTPAIRNLIREDKLAQIYSILQTGTAHGMNTLDQHLKQLVTEGQIERSAAYAIAQEKAMFD